MMAKNDALINKGIVIVGEPDSSKVSPIVVIGTARGGTSMVAGVLSRLGVYMGDRANHPVYEDVRLSEAFEKKQIARFKHIVEEYSMKHTHWGWKRPSTIDHLSEVNSLLSPSGSIYLYL